MDTFKAKLVAKGYTQKKGINYFDTYALVVRIITVRVLIALALMNTIVCNRSNGL